MRTWEATLRKPSTSGEFTDPTIVQEDMLMPFERTMLAALKGHRFIVRFDGPPFNPISEFVAQMIAAADVPDTDPVDAFDFAHDFLDVEETTPAGGA